jgi:hypothetical protein
MAGGWKRRRFDLPSSHYQSATRRRRSPKSDTSPSSIPENETMSIAAASDFERAPSDPRIRRLAITAACAALADWLLVGLPINVGSWPIGDWQIGISLPLFLGVLGIVAIVCNRAASARHVQIVMVAVFGAGLLALVEEVNILSVILGTLATAMFVIVTTTREAPCWQRDMLEAATSPFLGPFRLASDVVDALRHIKRSAPGWLGSLVAWIVPLSVFAVFLALFSSANPLIEHRLMQIDLSVLLGLLGSWRMGFWILIICAIWPLIYRRFKSNPVQQPKPHTTAVEPSDLDFLLGEKAILRSLILFNALFALQSGLDLTYLWGGANLPDGMNHAEYAHRGAYPLIATALLAAGFVLVAMRPNGPAEHSRLIRPLVLLWTAQNILLVVSSIFRLDLYVAAFSLTYLRFAAFVWMVLVAAGLVLMLIQIALRKPNSWLIAANAISLALVLYACCFINTPYLVASYNVEHSREVSGTGPNLDLKYLGSLGPQAEPALRPHVKEMPVLQSVIFECRLRANYLRSYRNWRGWSFRTWRLERYLANNPDTPPSLSDSGRG